MRDMTQTIGQLIKWDFETNGSLIIQDKYNKLIYLEASDRFWVKKEYDSQGNCNYYETSCGQIVDDRPKPCEGKIVEIDGEKFKLVKA